MSKRKSNNDTSTPSSEDIPSQKSTTAILLASRKKRSLIQPPGIDTFLQDAGEITKWEKIKRNSSSSGKDMGRLPHVTSVSTTKRSEKSASSWSRGLSTISTTTPRQRKFEEAARRVVEGDEGGKKSSGFKKGGDDGGDDGKGRPGRKKRSTSQEKGDDPFAGMININTEKQDSAIKTHPKKGGGKGKAPPKPRNPLVSNKLDSSSDAGDEGPTKVKRGKAPRGGKKTSTTRLRSKTETPKGIGKSTRFAATVDGQAPTGRKETAGLSGRSAVTKRIVPGLAGGSVGQCEGRVRKEGGNKGGRRCKLRKRMLRRRYCYLHTPANWQPLNPPVGG